MILLRVHSSINGETLSQRISLHIKCYINSISTSYGQLYRSSLSFMITRTKMTQSLWFKCYFFIVKSAIFRHVRSWCSFSECLVQTVEKVFSELPPQDIQSGLHKPNTQATINMTRIKRQHSKQLGWKTYLHVLHIHWIIMDVFKVKYFFQNNSVACNTADICDNVNCAHFL